MTTEQRIRQHIVQRYAKTNLRVFTREELQDFLEAKARQRLSESVLKHLRWDLRQIFEMAVAEGHLSRNPARLLFTPRSLTGSTKLIMNMEEVNECFRVLPLRERLIVKMAVLAGMRPGEILGLTWSVVNEQSCDIQVRVYRGDVDTPKPFHSAGGP